ncbi:hypothetical protein HC864_04045 [Candidatus Gracilibacteria bacterium]|nr:hypothetical protein [Candidatus Gracilibacteria bacterium]
MFKSSSILPVECVFELAKLNQKIIKSIEIRAVEKIGVKGRAGYYDTIGATKDMWQHLFSLTNLLANYSGKKLSWTKFEVNNYQTGQYQTYLNDLKLKSSTTESYFGLEGKIGDILVKAESGKKLGTKETSIQVTYEDGSSIKWNIDKQKFLAIYNSDGQLINSTSLSQQNLLNDHTNLFNYILQENPSRFVTNEQVICSWLTFNKIKNFKTSLKKYKDGIYPVKWLD